MAGSSNKMAACSVRRRLELAGLAPALLLLEVAGCTCTYICTCTWVHLHLPGSLVVNTAPQCHACRLAANLADAPKKARQAAKAALAGRSVPAALAGTNLDQASGVAGRLRVHGMLRLHVDQSIQPRGRLVRYADCPAE